MHRKNATPTTTSLVIKRQCTMPKSHSTAKNTTTSHHHHFLHGYEPMTQNGHEWLVLRRESNTSAV